MSQGQGILLTGATGFLGGDLLTRLLARRPEATVYCLVRARKPESLERRRQALLDWAEVSMADRERVLGSLKDPPRPIVVTNARCLTEGIDVPALGAVAFVDPRFLPR